MDMDTSSEKLITAEGEGATQVKTKKNYWKFIDGLRAVAIVIVLLFHFEIPGFKNGYIGVDVFFVISGFLVTQTNLDAASEGTFTLKNFYFRRMRRLFPELFLLLFVTVGVSLLLASPQGLLEVLQSGVAQALFAANYYFWSQVDYFDTGTSAKPLLHCWSLSVEEQFYLVFSIFLLFLSRLGARTRSRLVGVLTLCSLTSFLCFGSAQPSLSFYSLPTRMWEPLTGALIRLELRSEHALTKNKMYQRLRPLISLQALLCLSGAVALEGSLEESGVPVTLIVVVAVLSSAVFIFVNAESEHPTLIGAVLALRPCAWVGSISYSLYLWHWPMICYFRCFFSFTKPPYPFVGLVCVVVGVSVVSDYGVGRPLRRKSMAQWSRLSVLVPLLYLSLCVSLLHLHPFPQRTSFLTSTFNWTHLPNYGLIAQNAPGGGAGDNRLTCPYYCSPLKRKDLTRNQSFPHWEILACGNCSDLAKARTIVTLGDSHSMVFMEGTKNLTLSFPNTCWILISSPACLPLYLNPSKKKFHCPICSNIPCVQGRYKQGFH